jgi:hypothetical protein
MKKKNFLTKNLLYSFFGPVLSILLGVSFILGLPPILSIPLSFTPFSIEWPSLYPNTFPIFWLLSEAYTFILLASLLTSLFYFVMGIVLSVINLFVKTKKRKIPFNIWIIKGLIGIIIVFILFFFFSLYIAIFGRVGSKIQLPY